MESQFDRMLRRITLYRLFGLCTLTQGGGRLDLEYLVKQGRRPTENGKKKCHCAGASIA